MQKLLKRTAQAEKQVLRRRNNLESAQGRGDYKTRIRAQGDLSKEVTAQVRLARKARREDWELGPLAPRRDTPWAPEQPLDSYQTFMYGSISNARIKPQFNLRPEELEARCAWAGGRKHLCLAVGDRVVLIEGHEKGKIDSIVEINKGHGLVKLKGAMESNVTLPPWALNDAAADDNVHTTQTFVPIDAIRLVHPITDPATGRTRDVIIRQLQSRGHALDKPTRRFSFWRIVPGLNVSIPWPSRADGGAVLPTKEEHPGDTLRIDVEPTTFVPTLLRPPMPEVLINELRNKYSRFRTRHEPEYIARKEAEQAEKMARHKATTMRTPLQEFHMQERERRRARGQPVLSEEMLEKIGQVMEKNRTALLKGVASEDGAAGKKGEMPLPPLVNVGTEDRAPLP